MPHSIFQCYRHAPQPRRGSAIATKTDPVYFNRFIALDFETADYGRDSACAIALVLVDKCKIVDTFTSLIRPPRSNFQFTWLHGISWDDVKDKPTFGELWPNVQPLFDGVEFIAAHNAAFDRGVLAAGLESQSIAASIPDRYLCTMKLSRILWDIYPTKLSDVCYRFSIPLEHHQAESDATACAKIVLRADGTGLPKRAFLPPYQQKKKKR